MTADCGLLKGGEMLAELSEWIDEAPANAARDREAATWGRIAKVAEECGEVVAAFIGATGQNPRKGVHATGVDVIKELLDVALTALCAVEHFTNADGSSLPMFVEHLTGVHRRAGLADCGLRYPKET